MRRALRPKRVRDGTTSKAQARYLLGRKGHGQRGIYGETVDLGHSDQPEMATPLRPRCPPGTDQPPWLHQGAAIGGIYGVGGGVATGSGEGRDSPGEAWGARAEGAVGILRVLGTLETHG